MRSAKPQSKNDNGAPMKKRSENGIGMKCPHCDGTGRLSLERATYGEMILARRKAMGMTQDELSKKVMLSRAQIANVETGRSDIPMKTLQRFAEALECSPRDLLPG
jgi:DNA-binding Xre family transcriptional regulator